MKSSSSRSLVSTGAKPESRPKSATGTINNKTLPRSFYSRNTLRVAKDLIGTFLVHDSPKGLAVGRIVETEAYLFKDDPASHAYRGMTKRNAPMFGPAGRSYIYFIYGMHYCFNIVTGKPSEGVAVLIRALEPVFGLELMVERRGTDEMRLLCSGPARLVEAMGITREHNQADLTKGRLTVVRSDSFPKLFKPVKPKDIVSTHRIGISKGKELPYRYYLKDNPFVSNFKKGIPG